MFKFYFFFFQIHVQFLPKKKKKSDYFLNRQNWFISMCEKNEIEDKNLNAYPIPTKSRHFHQKYYSLRQPLNIMLFEQFI